MKLVFRELVGQTFIYGIGASLNGLAAFLLIPFFTRHLTATEYGRYALAEMTLSLLLVALALGMNVAILARYPKIPTAQRHKFFGSVLAFMLLSTLALDGLFLVSFSLIREYVLPELDFAWLLMISAISFLETMWLMFATLFRAESWAWRYIGASALQVVVTLTTTVALILQLGYREKGIFLGRLIGDCVVVAAVLLTTRRPILARPDWPILRRLLKIGIPLIPATLSSMWLLTSQRYIIGRVATVTDVGIFAMSSRIAGVLSLLFVRPFGMAWMVALFKIYERPDAGRVYARVLTYYALIGALLALALGMVASVALPLLSTHSFPLSQVIVLTMALAYIASGLMYPLNIGPYVTEQTGRQTAVFVISAAVATLAGIPATFLGGAQGAALALLLAYGVQAALLSLLSQKLYRIPYEVGRLAKAGVAVCVAYLLTQALVERFQQGILPWLAAPVFLALSVLILVSLGFLDVGEVATLRKSGLWPAWLRRTTTL